MINAELSSAPEHTADPQHAENMQQLQRAVLERSADLGIAWDGDGDRLGVVDARGRRATPDRILALLARAHLERHPGAPIHVDVKVSQAVIEHIRSRGGRPVLGPVGHSLGKHAMQAAGIDFGGEASSHYFQRVASPAHLTDDAVRAACQVVQICSRGLAAETATLEQQLDEIPTWRTSPEVQLPCPDATKFNITAEVAEALGRDYPIVTIDGARADCSRIEPGAWALVRASNTTPNLTVRVEARTDGGLRASPRNALPNAQRRRRRRGPARLATAPRLIGQRRLSGQLEHLREQLIRTHPRREAVRDRQRDDLVHVVDAPQLFKLIPRPRWPAT